VLASEFKQSKTRRLVRRRPPRFTVVVEKATDRERLKEPRPKRSGRTAEPSRASVRTVINDLARILSAIHRSTVDRLEAPVRHPDVRLGKLVGDALQHSIVRKEVVAIPENDDVLRRRGANRLNHISERATSMLSPNDRHTRVATGHRLGNVRRPVIARVIDPGAAPCAALLEQLLRVPLEERSSVAAGYDEANQNILTNDTTCTSTIHAGMSLGSAATIGGAAQSMKRAVSVPTSRDANATANEAHAAGVTP